MELIHQKTTEDRTQSRRKNHTHTIDAHGAAALVSRKNPEHQIHAHGLHQPGHGPLPNPGGNQQFRRGREATGKGNQREHGHGGTEGLADTEAVQQPRRSQHGGGHGGNETGRQPVNLALADTELHHDIVQGNVDHRGTEHRGHGAEHHGKHRQPAPAVTISGPQALYGLISQGSLLLLGVFHDLVENLERCLNVFVGNAVKHLLAERGRSL